MGEVNSTAIHSKRNLRPRVTPRGVEPGGNGAHTLEVAPDENKLWARYFNITDSILQRCAYTPGCVGCNAYREDINVQRAHGTECIMHN